MHVSRISMVLNWLNLNLSLASLSWLSMDFVLQEHGVPRDGPKDSNAGG
jgi:hypothetical protein